VAVRPSASAEARGGEAGGAGAGDGYKGSHYEGGGTGPAAGADPGEYIQAEGSVMSKVGGRGVWKLMAWDPTTGSGREGGMGSVPSRAGPGGREARPWLGFGGPGAPRGTGPEMRRRVGSLVTSFLGLSLLRIPG